MKVKSLLAALAVATAMVAASQAAEACCRRGPPVGWWGPQPVSHYIYTPQYYNVYYMATFAPDPYPLVYVPNGYWPYYERPYAAYGRRYWWRRWGRAGCCAPRAAYAVPAPVAVPLK